MGLFHRHDENHDHSHKHDHDHPHDHYHDHPHSHEDSRDHSGYQTSSQRVMILEDIFAENDELAEKNRANFDHAKVKCVNLMSSPGSGKTEVLVATLKAIGNSNDRLKNTRVGIIEGDIETDLDAKRLKGLPAQITVLNTAAGFGGECHLDAPMVAHALEKLKLENLDLVFIENVGNLVCPAEFDVGEHYKAMVYSVTEGEDKPKKYPVMFRSVQVVLINKIDLLEYLDFDMALFKKNLKEVNPDVLVIEVCAKNSEGIETWINWIKETVLQEN